MPVLGVRFASLLAGAWFSIAAAAQSPAPPPVPAFDSALVQALPDAPDEFRAVLGTVIQGEIRLTNATLMECLRYAYGINNAYQIEGPDWMRSLQYRYNVFAKAPADTPLPQLRLMLQKLLAARFQMTLHNESREFAFLALVVSPNGLKLQAAKPGSDPSGNREILGNISSNSISIAQLTALLSRFLGQPVLDMTGLLGWFDVKLSWTPAATPAQDDLAANASIFAALEGQLGLTLERRKGPLDVIVVDRAEKTPTGN